MNGRLTGLGQFRVDLNCIVLLCTGLPPANRQLHACVMNGTLQQPCIVDTFGTARQSACLKVAEKKTRAKAVSHLSLELNPPLASSIFDRGGELGDSIPSTSGRSPSETSYVQFPSRHKSEPGSNQKTPTVRVKLNVQYRVHSRQMLCIGGSQLPFGWSFLSIAKVPLAWNPGDTWTTEVDLSACSLSPFVVYSQTLVSHHA